MTYLASFLFLPGILMFISEPKHSIIIETLMYGASLLLSLIFTIVAIIAIVITFEQLLSPQHGILWAWVEINKPETPQDLSQKRRKAIYRLVPAVLIGVTITAGFAELLRRTDLTALQLTSIVVLTPILTAFLVFIAEASAYISRPRVARLADSFAPGDTIIVDFINLAFFTNHNRVRWQERNVVIRLLSEYERAARAAEYAFPGLYRHTLKSDSATMSWAREQSARLAAGIREHKHSLILAGDASAMDSVTKSLCCSLVSACTGDWAELTKATAAPNGPNRLWRWTRLAIPPIVLGAAAVFVPFVVYPVQLRSTVRIYLIIAGILALITTFSPESQKAADSIQGILGKISDRARN